jgi:predicted nucleic acid-binding Zn ribbon protein
MSLKSANDILGILNLEAIREEQPFQLLLKSWEDIVGTKVAAQTRPLSIQRDILWVATSSAAWAQNLTFGRKALLLKLNQKLPTPLSDMRFSTAEWKRTALPSNHQQTLSPQEHPSYLGEGFSESEIKPITDNSKNAKTVFEDWARTRQERSRNLPLCPQCQCPCPPGELQRWGVCSLCSPKFVNKGIGNRE